jgi:hypothetical protein
MSAVFVNVLVTYLYYINHIVRMSLPLKVNPATLNLSHLTVHRAVLQFLRARWCEGAVMAAILYIKPAAAE